MRSPEEVAREIRRLTWDVLGNDGLVEEDGPALADLIRARDAEVRAEVDRIALTLSTMTTQGMAEVERIAEVAAALVGLTWEARTLDDGYSGWSGDERGGHAIHKTATRQRRLVGPWEPVETAVLLNPPTEGETDHADT